MLIVPLTGAADNGVLDVNIEKMRNQKGTVHACLTQAASTFPNCKADPAAIRLSQPASAGTHLQFKNVPPGDYALALIHDEDSNGKLDTVMKIPKEGFGFSGNPAIRMGPPKYESARFAIGSGANSQTVTMRYMF